MDAPAVQYTTTSDGVSIAWAEAGSGPALLSCGPTPFTHVQEHFALFEAYFGTLAGSFRLITFDARGTGMSQRDVDDVSAATLLLDAEAVIAAAKLDRFIVEAEADMLAVSTAIHLALALPERVTHIVLEAPFENMRELADTPYGRVGLSLAEADWNIFVKTFFRVMWGDALVTEWAAPFEKAAARWVDAPVGLKYVRAREDADVSEILAGVRQPTLVLRPEPMFIPARCCQRFAAKIPGAQFRQFTDPTYLQQAELIREFVGLSAPEPRSGAPPRRIGGLRTVLFTDIVGHTDMMQRLGDTKGRDVLREHERVTRETLKAHGGAEVKTMGDGFMASFGSVTSALDCAIALQRAFATPLSPAFGRPSPTGGGGDELVGVRIGLNAGEPIEEDGDLFGATVILASRIAAKAGAGEILIPEPVRHLLSGKSYVYTDRGEHAMKGFDDAVRLYDVQWRE